MFTTWKLPCWQWCSTTKPYASPILTAGSNSGSSSKASHSRTASPASSAYSLQEQEGEVKTQTLFQGNWQDSFTNRTQQKCDLRCLPASLDKLLDEGDFVLQVSQSRFLFGRWRIFCFWDALERLGQSVQGFFVVLVIVNLHLNNDNEEDTCTLTNVLH